MFDTQKEFLEKVDFEKNLQTTKKHEKLFRGQRVDSGLNVQLFAPWEIFPYRLFRKILSGIPSEYLTDLIEIRPNIFSGLVWIQSVCKGYRQTTIVSNELKGPFVVESGVVSKY